MADALSQFAEVLEKATDIDLACKELVFKTIKNTKESFSTETITPKNDHKAENAVYSI
jgi:hypothetical protein